MFSVFFSLHNFLNIHSNIQFQYLYLKFVYHLFASLKNLHSSIPPPNIICTIQYPFKLLSHVLHSQITHPISSIHTPCHLLPTYQKPHLHFLPLVISVHLQRLIFLTYCKYPLFLHALNFLTITNQSHSIAAPHLLSYSFPSIVLSA